MTQFKTSRLPPFKVALVQMKPVFADLNANLQFALSKLQHASEEGAALVVFPECALSGYVFDTYEEAMQHADAIPGIATAALASACKRLNLFVVIGMLEKDGIDLYNSAVVIGPEGIIAKYRKCHLPFVGLDRFTKTGSELCIVDLPFAKAGVLICYDLRFPEAVRSLALQGADVLILPTNWPSGSENNPDFLTRARAVENRMYVLACDRVGKEQGAEFIGRSQAVAPNGTVLGEADGTSEAVLYVEIDPELARKKRTVNIPGVYEFDAIADRRPELYGELTK